MMKTPHKYSLFIALGMLAIVMAMTPVAEARDDSSACWKDFEKNHEKYRLKNNYPYVKFFKEAANKYDVPLPLLVAMARGESHFNPRAVSNKNALGIMQILWPGTARHLKIFSKEDLFDPKTNIMAGAKYLKEMLDRYDGDVYLAVAAYNWGPRDVKKHSVPKGARWYAEYIFYDNLLAVLEEDYARKNLILINEYTNYDTAVGNLANWKKMAHGVSIEIRKSRKYTYDIFIALEPEDDRNFLIREFIERTQFTPLEIKREKGAY